MFNIPFNPLGEIFKNMLMGVVNEIIEEIFNFIYDLLVSFLVIKGSLSNYFPILQKTYIFIAGICGVLLIFNTYVAFIKNVNSEYPEPPGAILKRAAFGAVIIGIMPLAIDKFFVPLNNLILNGLTFLNFEYNDLLKLGTVTKSL